VFYWFFRVIGNVIDRFSQSNIQFLERMWDAAISNDPVAKRLTEEDRARRTSHE
jgi:hypothetical protein